MNNSSWPGTFTPAEQSRLIIILKAAVAAGFHSVNTVEERIAYHFTPDELERLVIYRRAIQAGFFTDQLEVHSHRTTGD